MRVVCRSMHPVVTGKDAGLDLILGSLLWVLDCVREMFWKRQWIACP